jgi:hypothetical protein
LRKRRNICLIQEDAEEDTVAKIWMPIEELSRLTSEDTWHTHIQLWQRVFAQVLEFIRLTHRAIKLCCNHRPEEYKQAYTTKWLRRHTAEI